MIALDKDTSVMIKLGAVIDSNKKYRSLSSIDMFEKSLFIFGFSSVYSVFNGT